MFPSRKENVSMNETVGHLLKKCFKQWDGLQEKRTYSGSEHARREEVIM